MKSYETYYQTNQLFPSRKVKKLKYTDTAKVKWISPKLGIITLQPKSTTSTIVPSIRSAISCITINYNDGHIDTLSKNIKYEVINKKGEKRDFARPMSGDIVIYNINSAPPNSSSNIKKPNAPVRMDTIAFYQLVQALHLDYKSEKELYPLYTVDNFDFQQLKKSDLEMLKVTLEQNKVPSRYLHLALSSTGAIKCNSTIAAQMAYFAKCYMTNEKYPGNQAIICPDYSKGQVFKAEIKKWLQCKIDNWKE